MSPYFLYYTVWPILKFGLITFGIILFIRIISAPRVGKIITHWGHSFEGMKMSPQRFYAELKKAIDEKGIPDIAMKVVEFPEGGVFSPRRKYLRIYRKEHYIEVCCAPFGDGCFFSYWQHIKMGFIYDMLQSIPLVGLWLVDFFFPISFYRMDTAAMFLGQVRAAIMALTDNVTKEQGIRGLSQAERQLPSTNESIRGLLMDEKRTPSRSLFK